MTSLASSISSLFSALPYSTHHLLSLLLPLVLYKILTADCDLSVAWACLTHPTSRLRRYYSNKVVWITGASSGLGKALALELAQYPCKLVLSARRAEELNKVKAECVARGLEEDAVLVLPMDSLDFERLPELVAKVLEVFGGVDVLVNNAGRSQRSLAETTPLDVDRAIMELNYFGYVALTKAVMPSMIANKRGSIVAMSSLTGKMGAGVSTAYSASKHAVMGFYNSLRQELYSYGIDVMTVCPGPVRSNISLHSFTENLKKEYNQEIQDKGRKQEAERFARLLSVALAARLPESWISIQPYLVYTYLAQYLPSVFNSALVTKGAQGRIAKFKNNECLY